MIATRRSFLIGLGAALAAPAIVRADSVMKIRGRRTLYENITLYVSSGAQACDTNTGLSPEAPFRTIRGAIDSIDLNGHLATIMVDGGSYGNELSFDAGNERVCLTVNHAHAVAIDGANLRGRGSLLKVNDLATVNLANMRFESTALDPGDLACIVCV